MLRIQNAHRPKVEISGFLNAGHLGNDRRRCQLTSLSAQLCHQQAIEEVTFANLFSTGAAFPQIPTIEFVV